MSLRDRLARPSPWATRFPPPERPWTPEYTAGHRELVCAALEDAALCDAAARGGRMPKGYAAGYDERTVEYPWMLGQGLRGRMLDAGSTFNHEHILDRVLPRVDALTIMTLEPEHHAFPLRKVSYVYGDLRELPFRDGWFHTVVSLSTLEHVGLDNTVYGDGAPPAEDAAGEAARAARELRRVTRPGGRILFSVPYGLREDHGWFRQFNADDLELLVSSFEPRRSDVVVFRYDRGGWQSSSQADAAAMSYRDFTADPSPVADLAAAARAVACVALEV